MANYKENYISLEEYKWYQQIGLTYDGFITGVGYAYTRNIAIAPAHMGRHNPPRFVLPGMDHYIQGRVQYIDTSDEAIELSLKGQVELKTDEEVEEASSSGSGLGNIAVNAIGPPLIGLASEILEGKHNAALSKNIDNLLPYDIDIKTGNTTWVNPKYIKYKNITARGGTILIFLINEGAVIGDYRSGTISQTEFNTNTLINILGSISPQYSALFLYMGALEYTENKWNEYSSKPNGLNQFYNNMNSAFEEWKRSMNGGF